MTGETDGTCAPVSAGKDPHSTCADETTATPAKPCGNDGTCDGKGACRKVGAGQECGPATCSSDGTTFTPAHKCDGNGTCAAGAPQVCTPYDCATTGCKRTCSSQDQCDAGTFCDVSLGVCVTKKSNGEACAPAAADRCSTGFCVDGHCCSKASCGTCEACTGAGGICVTVAGAEDPDTCSGTSSCNAAGACKKKNAQSCDVGSECLSGSCSDGVCCDRACSGSCEYCNSGGAAGTCTYVTGTPKSGHAACGGTSPCQGACDGTKAGCTMPGSDTACTPTCSSGTESQRACDGQGSCSTISTKGCTPYVCGATACKTTCSGNSDCSSGGCVGTTCVICSAGQSPCPSGCKDLSSDDYNCGSCGNSCGSRHCSSGNCVDCTSDTHCTFSCNLTTHTCGCRVPTSNNLLSNAGFDKPAGGGTPQLTSWAPQEATWSVDDADGCLGSGSANLGTMGAQISQCVLLGANVTFYFGFMHKGTGHCRVNYLSSDYRYTGCNLDNLIGASSDLYNTSASWKAERTLDTTIAGTQSAKIACTGSMGFGQIDQIFLTTSSSGGF